MCDHASHFAGIVCAIVHVSTCCPRSVFIVSGLFSGFMLHSFSGYLGYYALLWILIQQTVAFEGGTVLVIYSGSPSRLLFRFGIPHKKKVFKNFWSSAKSLRILVKGWTSLVTTSRSSLTLTPL